MHWLSFLPTTASAPKIHTVLQDYFYCLLPNHNYSRTRSSADADKPARHD